MTETEIVTEVYRALNRNDIPGTLRYFDPEIERIEWEGTPSVGICHGLEELEAHLIKGRSTWAEGGCKPEKFQVEGNKVMAFVHVVVRLKDKTDWIDGRVVDVFAFKNKKIVGFYSFFTFEQALAWIRK